MRAILGIGVLSGLMFATAAAAQSGADFYHGRTMKLFVGASPSGSYNAHARVVARHWPKHIPGKPAMIVQNMPAGAGVAATNHVYNISEKDGVEVGLFNRYTLQAPVLGVKQALYDVTKFNWLGTTAGYTDNAYVFVVRADLNVRTIDELRNANPPLNVGNVGAAPIRVLQEALGLKLNVIGGYQGDALDLAFERGEIDGHTTGYQTMMALKRHWIDKKYAHIAIQFGRADRLPLLADVPTARELTRNEADRKLIEFAEAPITIGYPFAAPPGVPADRVEVLRRSFADTMQDPEFQAEMRNTSLEYSPRLGAELEGLVKQLAEAPKVVTDRFKAIVGEQ